MNTRAQTIVITGFMGAGKSTVAAALAQRLGCEMIDLDRFIAKREMRTAQVIIDKDGEKTFREIETRALHAALETEDVRIIALGGGTWTIPENRALVDRYNGFTVWLDALFELCWKRIVSEDLPRPLARDFVATQDLYAKRRAAYQQATLRIEVLEGTSIDVITTKIVEALPAREQGEVKQT